MGALSTSIDKESSNISRVPQKVFNELFDRSLVTIMGVPPKDPNDDDEDEEDEDDGDDEEEEPAVIREPDEWLKSRRF